MISTKKKNLLAAIYEHGLHKVGSLLGHKLCSKAAARLDPSTERKEVITREYAQC